MLCRYYVLVLINFYIFSPVAYGHIFMVYFHLSLTIRSCFLKLMILLDGNCIILTGCVRVFPEISNDLVYNALHVSWRNRKILLMVDSYCIFIDVGNENAIESMWNSVDDDRRGNNFCFPIGFSARMAVIFSQHLLDEIVCTTFWVNSIIRAALNTMKVASSSDSSDSFRFSFFNDGTDEACTLMLTKCRECYRTALFLPGKIAYT